MVAFRRWTKEQREIATEMRRAKANFQEIGRAIGISRSAVRYHFQLIEQPEKIRELYDRRNAVARDRRAKERTIGAIRFRRFAAEPVSPQSIIAQRDQRYEERSAMSLTQILCGDPEPSRSSLGVGEATSPKGASPLNPQTLSRGEAPTFNG